ncbi:DnaJ C-terminal domain-containing protein [uncultured Rhodoblastus sp.]|uniref:DnaJ C-terminal domain-containing protein n=1 Tax=uncultured Rhodoblastus sp. TaxID=543037 RepID=UPI0025F6C2B3|nr:DnaJ C-terminal domain-containing protein [uncultured Rhodoblastus sp.]
MRDPYQILGVARDASHGDVKKAFRKLAKQHHPDQHPNDSKAKDRFAELNGAYEILGDEKKRAQFDRGEIDAEGKPRHPGFDGFGRGGGPGAGPGGFRRGPGGAEHFNFGGGGAGFDAADLFSDLFAGARGPRGGGRQTREPGADIALETQVSLETALNGGNARVLMPNGRTLEVAIPAGIEEGKQIRLRGQGQPSPTGGPAGDAMVTVRFEKHGVFRIEGRDLRLDLPIALYEAVLGAKVESPTLGGKVELNLPPHSNSGRTLRLRGKGLPAVGDKPAGDLLVTLRIALPEGEDADLEELMRRWRADKPYDPRSDLKK